MTADALNDAQRRAVEHDAGPLLILAGAGSGKTRVVTHRIARLLERGVDPRTIVAVTFTNKAAREMKERAVSLAGPAADTVTISTFHSACARLLRRHPRVAGLSVGFTIYDQDDQTTLIREVLQQLDMPHDAGAARADRALVEDAKNRALRVHDVRTEARDAEGERFADLFEAYQAALRHANACDFGDLIAHVVHGLRDDEGFRDRVAGRIEHLLVDEFQDTNVAQYELVSTLTPASGDVVVVGDDDQAIYGWRGATVENVRRFRDELPDCTVIALEQNYRSGPLILDAAHAVVEPLAERMEKRLFTDRTDGERVRAFVGGDDREEADFVAREITRHRAESGLAWDDFAVFFRTNAQSRALEEQLRRTGVPHSVRGSVGWFERREVKDALAYLRLAANPRDEVAFRRVANVPPRGIGRVTLRRLVAFHDAGGFSSFAESLRAVLRDRGPVRGRAKVGVEELATLLEAIAHVAERGSAAEVLEVVLTETAYDRWLRESDPIDGDDRAQNVAELLGSARDFAEESEDPSAAAFVEQAALATPDDAPNDSSAVQLMTIHSAKGLEFPVVFVTGLEKGQFPLERNGTVADPDEERRLCYVAFTRARDRLYLTAAMRRRLFGQTRETSPSLFLLDPPDHSVEVVRESARSTLDWSAAPPRSEQRRKSAAQEFDFDQRPWQERHGEVPSSGLVFGETLDPPARRGPDLAGRTARHRSFGDGTIIACDEVGGKIVLTVEFPDVGRRKVVRKYVDVLD